MNRFRPNFVVEDSDAFAEDNWKKVQDRRNDVPRGQTIGRRVMTTVDQAASVKTGTEPLKALASFRTRNGNVHFGQNMIADRAGAIPVKKGRRRGFGGKGLTAGGTLFCFPIGGTFFGRCRCFI